MATVYSTRESIIDLDKQSGSGLNHRQVKIMEVDKVSIRLPPNVLYFTLPLFQNEIKFAITLQREILDG